MFYAGNNTWKFRFTGTRTGIWSYSSSSSDADLDGISGTVIIKPNPNPNVHGFLKAQGNKFAIQSAELEIEGHLLLVFQNLGLFDQEIYLWEDQDVVNQVIQEAKANGANSIFMYIANYWLNFGSLRHSQHNSEEPDFRTFEMVENVITTAHSQGMNVHIWMWGDEDRKWTPIGLDGGINGYVDQRIQRYIAARLGPLPGWTMSYGFDLFEWVSSEQVAVWGDYMQQHMGWSHLLMAREEGSFHPSDNMHVFSTDERIKSGFYDNAVDLLDNSNNRPVILERRFTYMRDGVWDMNTTRHAMWQFTMAGGAAGWWGHFDNSPYPYPNKEQLVTHLQFWRGRFLLDMVRANDLTDGYALKETSKNNYVFYKEDTSSVTMDLSSLDSLQPAIAVDTKKIYAEINLGILTPIKHTWNAPYKSDWSIAVGEFNRQVLSEKIFLPAVIKKSSKTSSFDAFIPSTGKVGMILDQTGLETSDLSVSSNYWLVISGSIIFLFAIPTIYLIYKQRRTN
jgi:hypothetical protein